MFDCVFNLLPGCQVPLLACAGDDGSIQLLNFQTLEGELSCVKTTKVPGHEDWIRALAFTVEGTILILFLVSVFAILFLLTDGEIWCLLLQLRTH
jgi:WD40 repeat protein